MAKKVKAGIVKGVISDLKQRRSDALDRREMMSRQMDDAMAGGQAIGPIQRVIDNENKIINYTGSKINQYSKAVDKAVISSQKKDLAAKEAKFNRDYPLAPTFKGKK